MAPLNKARELAKREAAEKRKQCFKEDKENINGLSSVTAIKIHTPKIYVENKEADRQKTNFIINWVRTVNKERSIGEQEQWNQPYDWRFVTGNTLYKYVPFERNISISQAIDYITNKLNIHGPSTKKIKTMDDDTPIWYMSRNALRRTLYKASIRRRVFRESINLSSAHDIHPVTNLEGEL